MSRGPRPVTDQITLRLDRWASLLRNDWQTDDALDDEGKDQLGELSTLLTAAANLIGRSPSGWQEAVIDAAKDLYAGDELKRAQFQVLRDAVENLKQAEAQRR